MHRPTRRKSDGNERNRPASFPSTPLPSTPLPSTPFRAGSAGGMTGEGRRSERVGAAGAGPFEGHGRLEDGGGSSADDVVGILAGKEYDDREIFFLPRRVQVDVEISCIFAGIRYGTHFFEKANNWRVLQRFA